jgi:hypothetical protein
MCAINPSLQTQEPGKSQQQSIPDAFARMARSYKINPHRTQPGIRLCGRIGGEDRPKPIRITDCASNQDARSAPRRGEDRPKPIRINPDHGKLVHGTKDQSALI